MTPRVPRLLEIAEDAKNAEILARADIIRMNSLWLSNPMFTLGWKCTPIVLPSLKLQTLVYGSLILTLSYSLFLIFFFFFQIQQFLNASRNSSRSCWQNCLSYQPRVVLFCFSVKCFYKKPCLSCHIRKSNGSFRNSRFLWLEIIPRCQLFHHANKCIFCIKGELS